jgi:cytochrome c-type biogenesis protein CcmH
VPSRFCRRAALIGVFCVVALAGGPATAKEAPPSVADPALEARVMAIAEELRCLVCQNETIAASHAELAQDLRKQTALKLQAGQSQQEIIDFMVARYGEFVLYRPALNARTLLLWCGPFALLLVAGSVLAINVRRRRRTNHASEWTADNAQRARALLSEGDEHP